MRKIRVPFLVVATCVLCSAAPSAAKVKFDLSGYVESHLRFSMPGKAFERNEGEFNFNENRVSLKGDVDLTRKVSVKTTLRTIFFGFSNLPDGDALTQRANIDTFWWELDAAYVELRDLGIEGFDLRLGRQIVHWGTGDKFNPTNNINAYDFRDPIVFGQSMANNMVKMDYTTESGNIILTGIWVPVFRSGQLPVFGLRAFTDPAAFNKRFKNVDSSTRTLLDAFLNSGIPLDTTASPQVPQLSLKNSMAAAKFAFKLFGADMSLSYFRGFFNLPRPSRIQPGALGGETLPVQVDLEYPKMQAIGFDFTTSISWLGGMGLWIEGAVVFHDDLITRIELGAPLPDILIREQDAGAFLKLTVGIDYTFNKYFYMNIQYLHGFVDEFGASLLNDYVVAGFDLKNAKDTFMLRLFGVLNLQDRSHVYYPVLVFKPWGGAEFHVGALLYGGKAGTKFGDLDTGSNMFFMKARISF